MNKMRFLMLLFLSCTSFCAGAFFEVLMTGAGKEELLDLMGIFFTEETSSISLFTTFLQNLFTGLFIFLPSFFLPKWIILLPVATGLIFGKGFILGFSTSMLIEALGISGFLYSCITLLTWGIPELFLFSFYFVFSWHQRELIFHHRKTPQSLAGSYLSTYVLGVLLLLVLSLVKAFLLKAMI